MLQLTVNLSSGGSRISCRGVDPQCGCILAKMKELGPVGGHAPGMPLPPRSAKAIPVKFATTSSRLLSDKELKKKKM